MSSQGQNSQAHQPTVCEPEPEDDDEFKAGQGCIAPVLIEEVCQILGWGCKPQSVFLTMLSQVSQVPTGWLVWRELGNAKALGAVKH